VEILLVLAVVYFLWTHWKNRAPVAVD